jgi:phosphoribosyl-AMP cyclohydrolase
MSNEHLVPAYVVNEREMASKGIGAVLLPGFMNKTALERTIETGLVTFYSRTKRILWTKGERSGNLLYVQKILIDCDADSLIIDATSSGPSCHTGASSCFECNPVGE